MEEWLKITSILCCYGFFKELRPSEPYLTKYLLGPPQNLTEDEVYYDVFPVWTYSYLAVLVVVFLVTDLLRYKPVIIFESVAYIATWCLLLWATGVRWMQFMEFCYGIVTSTEVAYFTYIYAQVDAIHYQKVTSYTRSSFLFGRFLSGVLAELLTGTGLMNYHTLNYFTLASEIVALIFAILLPPVRKSIYFHREEENDAHKPSAEDENGNLQSVFNKNKLKKVARWLWSDFISAYTNVSVIKWSTWWIFATCIDFQVSNYIQVLWESVTPSNETENIYNGVVEASSTLLGSVTVFGIGYVHLNWAILGEAILGIISLIDAILLILMGIFDKIAVAYINYVIFRVTYVILITIASYQVAKEIRADSYGLIFGVNMFFSLLSQTILTIIVIEVLQLDPGKQFIVYGCFLLVLSVAFIVMAAYTFCKLGLDGIKKNIWEISDSSSIPEVSETPDINIS